jgi:1,4-alpha-glucan branching enzyme
MGLTKSYSSNKLSCRVTFILSGEKAGDAEDIFLVGDFNDWNTNANEMIKRSDGSFAVTVILETGCEYRYRYLIDFSRWSDEDKVAL